MKKLILPFYIALFLFPSILPAQVKENKYAEVDNFVQKLGSLDSFNVAIISDTLTRKIIDNENKVRAIFYWIANNISLDLKSLKNNDNSKSDPEVVIKSRKATPLGFAKLVQDMSSLANIRCLVIDGYVKNDAEEINNKADAPNHSWNVIQLGQSPDQWHVLDAAKASGFIDKKFTVFTKMFTSEYFFADKSVFNLDHFADNTAWQLGTGPKTLNEYYTLPIIGQEAYLMGLKKPMPANGFIKTTITKPVTFSFTYNYIKPISNIDFISGDKKKEGKIEPEAFTDNKGLVTFTHTFKKDDTYPVKILADGKLIMEYYAEVTEE